MSIIKCTVWKTSDGTLFERQDEALQYERVESLMAYWDNSDVDWRDVNPNKLAELALEWFARRGAPEVE